MEVTYGQLYPFLEVVNDIAETLIQIVKWLWELYSRDRQHAIQIFLLEDKCFAMLC